MSIRYLQHHEINNNAWDKCIASSFHGSIYSFSWYLDLVCENWDALVEDDYISVMPLPVHRFFGKEIIFLPVLLNELGIFSTLPITPEKTRAFIEAVPRKFTYYRIILNKYNPVEINDINPILRTHYELDLIQPYYKLVGDFDAGIQRKLHLAMTRGFSFISGLAPNDLILFITNNKIKVPPEMSKHNFRLLRSIIAGLIRYKSGELYGVYDNHNELASAALFAWINNRISMIFQVVATNHLADFAHLFLIDRFVEKYSETNTTLVFDSSIKSSSAIYYVDLGARETNHFEIIRNGLPFPLNILIHYRIFNTFLSSSQTATS